LLALLRADPPAELHDNSNLYSKMRVYDGESLKDIRSEGAQTSRNTATAAGVDEGMHGVSTRFAFKVLAETFNFDTRRSPPTRCTSCTSSRQAIRASSCRRRDREALPRVHQGGTRPALRRVHRQRDPEGLSGIVQEYGQNLFDRYIDYADAWIEDQDYKDPIPAS
jgi:serine protein kinase